MSLIAVIMKAPTSVIRFNNATNLLNYGFTNYELTSLGKKGDIVKSIKVDKGPTSYTNAVFESDSFSIISKGNSINIDKEISLPEKILAPVKQGEIIGTVIFKLNNEIIAKSNLVSDKTINKINIFSMSSFIINNWFNLCR